MVDQFNVFQLKRENFCYESFGFDVPSCLLFQNMPNFTSGLYLDCSSTNLPFAIS